MANKDDLSSGKPLKRKENAFLKEKINSCRFQDSLYFLASVAGHGAKSKLTFKLVASATKK